MHVHVAILVKNIWMNIFTVRISHHARKMLHNYVNMRLLTYVYMYDMKIIIKRIDKTMLHVSIII